MVLLVTAVAVVVGGRWSVVGGALTLKDHRPGVERVLLMATLSLIRRQGRSGPTESGRRVEHVDGAHGSFEGFVVDDGSRDRLLHGRQRRGHGGGVLQRNHGYGCRLYSGEW